MPTSISDKPITEITTPITTGGKKRSSLPTIGASRMPTTPAAIVEPKMSRMPSDGLVPIATIGPTAANVQPMMTGRRMPKIHRPERLDQRGDAAGKQVGADQERDLVFRQLECGADDQRHRDGAGVHHQNVLNAEREQLARGQSLVARVNRVRLHIVCLHHLVLGWLQGIGDEKAQQDHWGLFRHSR